MYDVCIIGAGVIGMSIARELTRSRLSLCILEKGDDVASGCSKANSGIVHGGYSDEPGTLKAQLCLQGNRLYDQLNQELHFGYRQTGSLVLAFTEEETDSLAKLYEKGLKNGVTGLEIISGDEARQREPHISSEVKAALLCSQAGVTSPYELVIALAENAVANGAVLRLNSKVTAISPQETGFLVTLHNGETVASRYVINAAGAYSDEIARLAGLDDYRISPRRGQYVLLDKEQNYLASSVLFQVPSKLGKGILVTVTYHGNLMIGPNAEEIDDKDDVGTDDKTLEYIVQTARRSVPGINMKKALKSFAGNRPVSNQKDWVIEESRIKGFINLIGIDSPGLTSAPAIAVKTIDILRTAGLSLEPNPSFNPIRPPVITPKGPDFSGDIHAADPQQHIICRCENVTEAEIVDSLHRGIPVSSLSAVSRRTRAGHGSCQGAFCGSRVRQLIARELNILPEEVSGRGEPSSTLAQRAKRADITKI